GSSTAGSLAAISSWISGGSGAPASIGVGMFSPLASASSIAGNSAAASSTRSKSSTRSLSSCEAISSFTSGGTGAPASIGVGTLTASTASETGGGATSVPSSARPKFNSGSGSSTS